MRIKATFMILALSWAMLFAQGQKRQEHGDLSPCSMVRQALDYSIQIKPGTTRREVEQHFLQDGGLQFAERTRYVFAKCNYIKLEIDFNLVPRRDRVLFSPEDTVSKVSRPYLDYPAKD